MEITNDACDGCIHKGLCMIEDKLDDFVIRMNRAEVEGWPLSSWIGDIPKEVTFGFRCKRYRSESKWHI